MIFDELKDMIITNGDFHEFGMHHMIVKDRCVFTLWEGLQNDFNMVFEEWAKNNRDHKYVKLKEHEADDILIWYNEYSGDTIIGRSISDDYNLKDHHKALVTDISPAAFKDLEEIYGSMLTFFLDAVRSQVKMYIAPSLSKSGLEISASKMKEMSELRRYYIKGIPNVVFRNITEPTDSTVAFVENLVEENKNSKSQVHEMNNNVNTKNGLLDVINGVAGKMSGKMNMTDILKFVTVQEVYACLLKTGDMYERHDARAMTYPFVNNVHDTFYRLVNEYPICKELHKNPDEFYLFFVTRSEEDGEPQTVKDVLNGYTLAVYECAHIDDKLVTFSQIYSDEHRGLNSYSTIITFNYKEGHYTV